MNYRLAEQNDMQEIMEVLTVSFDRVYAYYARKSFTSPESIMVAEDGNKIYGVINWRIFQPGAEKIGYLFWLAVHPDGRRKGIAEGLVVEAVKHIRSEIGLADIYAAIDKHNEPSWKLFEKVGFVRIKKSVMKEKYGLKRFALYSHMMLVPGEVLYRLSK